MRRQKKLAGFTLVELMVVIAIIGLLAAVVTVNVMGQTYDARKARCKADMRAILDACKLFKVKHGFYPAQMQDLVQQPANARDWKQLLEEVPIDPWGNQYQYEYTSGKPKIISLGARGEQGGVEEEADLDSETIFQVDQNQ